MKSETDYLSQKKGCEKMKILVVPTSTNIKKYEKNAQAFLFGLKNFSYTTKINLNINQIKKIKQQTDKEIFIKIDKNTLRCFCPCLIAL